MERVVVLTGGSTPERNVALAGAGEVVTALREAGYECAVVDTCRGPLERQEEGVELTAERALMVPEPAELEMLAKQELGPRLLELEELRRADLLFLVLHGRDGEGGLMQALLELGGHRFTGSDALGSFVAMDKDLSKRLLAAAGVATPDWATWPVSGARLLELGLPLVVKPSRVGSTVGLSIVRDLEEIEDAVAMARRFDREILVERFIAGRELTVAVLGDRALGVGEIRPQHEIFDYECKYTPGMSEEIFPAPIDEATTERARRAALAAHRALKLRDYSRVDFRLDAEGELFCLEANTLPGMTKTSLLPQSAAVYGYSFSALCAEMCRLALERDG